MHRCRCFFASLVALALLAPAPAPALTAQQARDAALAKLWEQNPTRQVRGAARRLFSGEPGNPGKGFAGFPSPLRLCASALSPQRSPAPSPTFR